MLMERLVAEADAALQGDSAAQPPGDADTAAFLTARPAPPPPPVASIPAVAPSRDPATLHLDAQQLDRQQPCSQATGPPTAPEGPAVVPPSLPTPAQPLVLQQQQQQETPETPSPARPEPNALHQLQPAVALPAQDCVGAPPPRLNHPVPSPPAAASSSVAEPRSCGATSQPVRPGASPPWSASAPPPSPLLQPPTLPAEVRRRPRVATRLCRPLQLPTVHFPIQQFHLRGCRSYTGARWLPPSLCT